MFKKVVDSRGRTSYCFDVQVDNPDERYIHSQAQTHTHVDGHTSSQDVSGACEIEGNEVGLFANKAYSVGTMVLTDTALACLPTGLHHKRICTR